MKNDRQSLPHLGEEIFLTDGGLETTLIFHHGLELPHFACFPLLDDAKGRAELTAYYEPYLAIARDHGRGFILDTPTWRANPDWAEKLGYDLAALRALNIRSVEYIADLRRAWQKPGTRILLNGAIGPRGDAYQQGQMSTAEAEKYHAHQIGAFAETEVDMVTALTLNTTEEAIGIIRAAKAVGLPVVISFTVETDGRLANGMSLEEAIETTDAMTGSTAAYYMINCAHPSHFDHVLGGDAEWLRRIGGIRANASAKSHAELDESTELDIGDPQDLGRRYARLTARYPSMRVLGGCCGTDHRHVAAICEACAPRAAAE
ncbi:Homocysteine/selenocysteine methylase (S-methylmethionine-dependent) [Rhizobium sp. NFR07]|uniref:homocysteine S-methyltransferase family protein n=1 Tax=Rhizobium sp. NFR07 TaxID=1566262 RepID=UPI0008DF463A|nr:homocysteine S-methyltransferase family protein [Rhizobium sp. NFR07]SFB46489.1 Homocysteine/selenocysteine methylase (S-methylmethionine-dependent) [Rhizobium sp. NFR07]